jgi:phosphopantothenoylcysteine decarboxylase/phosphopantothenate--cysteine ligase
MGYELAAAAHARGGDVTLLSGPTALDPPQGVGFVPVETTADLGREVGDRIADTDLLVMAAAPSDFRPQEPQTRKRPRREGPHTVVLDPTDDILESTRQRRRDGCVVIGFALETEQGTERARDKLARKGLDLIVLNMATEPDAGFEAPTNRVTLIDENGTKQLPLLPKREVAEKILDAAMEHL